MEQIYPPPPPVYQPLELQPEDKTEAHPLVIAVASLLYLAFLTGLAIAPAVVIAAWKVLL